MSGTTPAAVIEVGRRDGPLWSEAFGRLTFEDDAPLATVATIFDLASLTKVIATTSLAMQHVHAGRLDLDRRLGHYVDDWTTGERGLVSIRHLLDHSSGLPAHARLWTGASGRAAYERELARLPFEAAPGERAEYSDVGFMLLGFAIEAVGRRPLDEQMREFGAAVELGPLTYLPPDDWRLRTAPTEFDPWRNRLLVGEVHDENAAALGGVAGHAGLFGTAAAVGRFARLVLAARAREAGALTTLPLMTEFSRPTAVSGSSRALGWDTMRPTSSCGTLLSPDAIGHTGFTGTSLWIDPAADLYIVLLSNRVHPTRSNIGFRAVRPRVHDAVVTDLRASDFVLRT